MIGVKRVTVSFHGDHWVSEHYLCGQLIAICEYWHSPIMTAELVTEHAHARHRNILIDRLERENRHQLEQAA
jgi:hypothetical protein